MERRPAKGPRYAGRMRSPIIPPPGNQAKGLILVVVATPVCFAALDGGLGLVRSYHAVLMSSSIFSDGFL